MAVSRAGAQRALLLVVTTGVLFVALWARLLPQAISWSVGDRADRTVRATRSAIYEDTETTEELRRDAERKVPDQYRVDATAAGDAERAVRDIFSQVRRIGEELAGSPPTDKLEALRRAAYLEAPASVLRLLVEAEPGALTRMEDSATALVRAAMSKPIRDNTDDLETARQKMRERADSLGLTLPYARAAVEVAAAALEPNQILDSQLTAQLRKEQADAVPKVRGQIQPGQIIISAGDVVGQRHVDMFLALGLMSPTIDYLQALGMLILLMTAVLALGLYCYRFSPSTYHDLNRLLLTAATLLGITFAYRLAGQTPYFEPVAIAAASTGAMLLGLSLGATVGVGVSTAAGLIVGLMTTTPDVRIVIVTMLCGSIAAHVITAGAARRRHLRVGQAALAMAAANSLLLTAGNMVFAADRPWQLLAAAAVGGFLAPVLAVGTTLMIERPLGILTDMRLLELGNPNEPVLRELLREAPASYQGSIMVANLAEQAAEAIGANALLAHTAALYHDIGKVKRPYFFVENQSGPDNPHDRLHPSLSALILASHVKEGLEIAREAGLPEQIAAVIPEHHGTSLMSYFYDKALREAPEGTTVDENAFRYPGPKPRSKETAIIMLADTVEAASRTLEDPSAARIEGLVERLVDAKIADGQLDEAPLTLADIRAIKRSLTASLAHIYHHRIKYPEQIRQEAERAAEAYRRAGWSPEASLAPPAHQKRPARVAAGAASHENPGARPSTQPGP